MALCVTFALRGVDGMVLCFCDGGGVEVETACSDAGRCCDDAPANAARASTAHECSECTDVRLSGLDLASLAALRSMKKDAPDASTKSLPAVSSHLVVGKSEYLHTVATTAAEPGQVHLPTVVIRI